MQKLVRSGHELLPFGTICVMMVFMFKYEPLVGV